MCWFAVSGVKRQKLIIWLGAALALGLLPAQPSPAAPAAQKKPHKPTGVARSTPASRASSQAKTSRKSRRSRVRKQFAPTPARIREIQSALANAGYYREKPTGKWDATTAGAMRRFQEANGLNSTGKIDALSLQKLGLGSEVAGLAAPQPASPPIHPPESPHP